MQINFQQPQDSAAVFAACLKEAKAIVTSYRSEAPTGCDPQNIGQLGNDFDPSNANYEGNILGSIYVGGLIGLVGFAGIGIGAFFSYVGGAAAPASPLVVGYITVGGSTITYVNDAQILLSAAQMVELAEMTAGTIPFSYNATVIILQSWGLTAFSIDSILALAAFNAIAPNPNVGPYFGGHHTPGNPGGGSQTPPGFPGFGIGGNFAFVDPFGGTVVCYHVFVAGQLESFCEYQF